jgi:hypothetical protein
MIRRYLAAMFGALFLLALAPGTTQAHVATIATRVGINEVPAGAVSPGQRVVIYGRLRSAEQDCREGHTIRLLRRRLGPDEVVATDVTDAEGEYRFIRRPGVTQVVYARFNGAIVTSYGHSHTCSASKSRGVRLNVFRG